MSAPDSAPTDAEEQYRLGVRLWQSGEKTSAIQALRRAERLGMNSVAFHRTLGLAYLGIYQFTLFRGEMETAMRLDPRDPQPYFHMGRYYESILNQYDRALEYFRKAVAAGPTDGRSAAYEAYCLELLGHVEEARRGYETAIRLLEARADRFSWPVSRLARLALEENDPDRALFQARRAVELEPQLAGNHLLLGKVHLKKGAIPEAVKALSEAIRLDPRDPSAYYLLSTAYAALDRKEAARDALEMFRRLKSVYGTQ